MTKYDEAQQLVKYNPFIINQLIFFFPCTFDKNYLTLKIECLMRFIAIFCIMGAFQTNFRLQTVMLDAGTMLL